MVPEQLINSLSYEAMLVVKKRLPNDSSLCAKIFNVETGQGIVSLEFTVDPSKSLECKFRAP
jgi:hypothetical protein